MALVYFNRNIPDECHQKIGEFAAAGNDVIGVAFAPGAGAHWSVFTKSGAFFNRNIPPACHQAMSDLETNGAKIAWVAFPPAGGDSWSAVNDHGGFINHNIPPDCHQAMLDLSKNGARIVCIAFPPAGGDRWTVVNNQGAFVNRNIPDECHQTMQNLSKNGARIIHVAFPPQGGNSWSIVNNHGAYFNRNISEEAHMFMGFIASVYGPPCVAFDMDGNGFSVFGTVTKNEKVCDATQCVSIADVYRNVSARLDGNVVGYACTVGKSSLGAYSHGYARTSANAPAKLFLPSTKIGVASVSKVITALAAIRVIGNAPRLTLDSGIGGHLPSDWTLDPNVASITFRQLLSQRSGIKDYGNNDQSYATLKAFFTKQVDPTKNTLCQPASVVNPANPFNVMNKSWCYSNYNFGIFRVLLPMIVGFVDDPAHRAEKLAAAYVKIVQQNVFQPVGAIGVDTKPPASGPQATGYAFSYQYPGTMSGHDWGDATLGAGGAGWYLAIDDIAKVLDSLNRNDGRILTNDQWVDMQTLPMGWDKKQDSKGYRFLEKNGGWGWGGTTISTTIALFGPGVFGALFMNSDFSEPGRQNNWQRCTKCQVLSFAGSPSLGACPAGGTHDHTNSRNYLVAFASSGLVGQANWRWCNKCQALSFGGVPAVGPCSAGGQHDHSGSGNYVLAQKAAGLLPLDTEENWRWCNKCQGLAYAGDPAKLGACKAGGQHDHAGSGNYLLDYIVGADTVLYEAYMKALHPK